MSNIKTPKKNPLRIHRLNPEEIFDLTSKSKFWKKTLLNYEQSNLKEERGKVNHDNKTDNST